MNELCLMVLRVFCVKVLWALVSLQMISTVYNTHTDTFLSDSREACWDSIWEPYDDPRRSASYPTIADKQTLSRPWETCGREKHWQMTSKSTLNPNDFIYYFNICVWSYCEGFIHFDIIVINKKVYFYLSFDHF